MSDACPTCGQLEQVDWAENPVVSDDGETLEGISECLSCGASWRSTYKFVKQSEVHNGRQQTRPW